jgi:hypothetical protein
LFAGLSAGVHTARVREQSNTDCVHEHIFEVNVADITFDFTLEVQHESIPGGNNGQITADVTGTGGPFEFKKEGFAYQDSNIFPGLAPGVYYITVKDATDGTLTKFAIVLAKSFGGGDGFTPFEGVFFSKNPVTYQRIASDDWEELDNYRMYNDVHVENDDGDYVSALKVEQPPASDGTVLFSVRRAFRNFLKAIPPTLNNGTITRLTDRIRFFKHFTGELQDDEVTPEDLEESEPYLVLLGGLSTLKFPQINFFGDYIHENKKFMSWAPLEKVVDRQQEDYLNFFVYNTNITTVRLKIKAYYDDGTDNTDTIETRAVSIGQLLQIPAGPANSHVLEIEPEKNLVKYDLWLERQTGAEISEVRTYVIAQVSHPLTRYFMVLNSMGAYEVHRFTGVAVLSTDFEGEAFEKYLPPDYTNDDIQFQNDSVTFQNKGSFSTGYIKGNDSAAWLAYLRDMLKTSRLYDVTSGTRVPMVITTRQMIYKEDQNHERFVRFEAYEAYTNESHTPEEI